MHNKRIPVWQIIGMLLCVAVTIGIVRHLLPSDETPPLTDPSMTIRRLMPVKSPQKPAGPNALKVPLQYVKAPELNSPQESKEFFPRNLSYLEGKPEAYKLPPGSWKLPKLVSRYPIYYQIRIGDETRLMIIDQNFADDFYTRLYFDANGNRDLTDDPPLHGVSEQWGGINQQDVNFPIVEFTLNHGEGPLKYAIQPNLHDVGDWMAHHKTANVGYGVACWYVGECDLDGGHFRLALYDHNGNGYFDDFCAAGETWNALDQSPNPSGDLIFIMPRGSKGDWSSSVPLTQRLNIGKRVYEINIDMAHGMLFLTPSKE